MPYHALEVGIQRKENKEFCILHSDLFSVSWGSNQKQERIVQKREMSANSY